MKTTTIKLNELAASSVHVTLRRIESVARNLPASHLQRLIALSKFPTPAPILKASAIFDAQRARIAIAARPVEFAIKRVSSPASRLNTVIIRRIA